MTLLAVMGMVLTSRGAELESRALTHYVPQDLLETIIRKESWTEIVLKPYDGVRKGDIARIWSGGMIDYCNGTQPGVNVAAPSGPAGKVSADDAARMALSPEAGQAYSLLFKTEDGKIHKCLPMGKPLQIPLTKDGARLWVGFNDLRGQYADNHLGQGRRYERDPAWVRIEVIRIIVD
jgi:hypothetical protein